jgi:hypothetical protein
MFSPLPMVELLSLGPLLSLIHVALALDKER